MPKGMDFTAAAYCEETGYGDRCEVFCPSCLLSFGTIHLEDVTRAIFATLGRGGLLCPDCRSVTCDSCGKMKRVVHHKKISDGTDLQLCANCLVYLRELKIVGTPWDEDLIPL